MVVVLVADVAEAEASTVVVAFVVAVLVASTRQARCLVVRECVEAELASAYLALQVESRTLRLGLRMSIHLDRLDHLCGKVLADVRRVA